MTTPSRNKSALPHVVRTLPQAELFHWYIVGRVAKGNRVDCPELTGRDAYGRPLRHPHLHSHVLPLDLDDDSRIDHILIYAPMGLGAQAQRGLRSMKRTWMKGGVGELQLAVVGRGNLQDLRRLGPPLDRRINRLLGPSCQWVSQTPFVPPRFVKRHGRNAVAGQVQAELRSRGLPEAVEIDVLPESVNLRHYVRTRSRGAGPPPRDVGLAIRIQFDESIPGPLTLGYASHFGLGLFQEVEDVYRE